MAAYPTSFQKNTAGESFLRVDQWGNAEPFNLDASSTGLPSGVNNLRIEGNTTNTAAATGLQAIALGSGTIASGDGAIAIGPEVGGVGGATAAGDRGIAIGSGKLGIVPSAPSVDSIAIGAASVANGTNSVAIGADATTAFSDSVALGPQASCSGSQSAALGPLCTVSNGQNVAMGWKTTNSGGGSIAIGIEMTNTRSSNIIFGDKFQRFAEFSRIFDQSQSTSLTTAIPSAGTDKTMGRVALFNGSLAASTVIKFTLTNNRIQTDSMVYVSLQGVSDVAGIPLVCGTSNQVAGAIDISIYNPDAANAAATQRYLSYMIFKTTA